MQTKLSISNTIINIVFLIVGIMIGTTQIFKGVYDHFYAKNRELSDSITQDYLLIDNNAEYPKFKFYDILQDVEASPVLYKNQSIEELLARQYVKQINDVQSNFETIYNKVLESAFNPIVHRRLELNFCEDLSYLARSEPKLKEECKSERNSYTDGSYKYVLERSIDMAFYAITNHSGKPFKNIEIEYAVFDLDSPISSLDSYLDGGLVKNECLHYSYIPGNAECTVDVSRTEVVKIDNLASGKKLLFPMYFHTGFSKYSDVRKEYYYDGYISTFPMYFPTKVIIDGEVVIDKVREMMPTPKITLGDYEIRG